MPAAPQPLAAVKTMAAAMLLRLRQLRTAVQTMAVAMPAAPQLLAAVEMTAVEMRRLLRCHLRHN